MKTLLLISGLAYILTKNYDTIRGYIMYRDVNLSKTCSFKQHPDDKSIDYLPSDISGFRFLDGKYFISKKVLLDKDSLDVFLEFLIKGKASVYYLRDETDHYFIERENGSLLELTEKEKVYQDADGENYIRPKLYQGKLKAVLSDCQDIFPEISKTDLTHSSLIRLAKDYHHRVCTTEDCMVFEAKFKPVRVDFGFHGGYSGNSLGFGSQLTSNTRSTFFFGGRIEFENLIKWTERISVVCEINYQTFSTYEFSEDDQDVITYNGVRYQLGKWENSKITADLKTTSIKVPVIICYSFFNGKFRPFVGLGFSNQIVLDQNKDFVHRRFYDEYKHSIPFYQLGFGGKAGIKIYVKARKFIYVEAGYESVQNLNANEFLRFSDNMFSVVSGFSF